MGRVSEGILAWPADEADAYLNEHLDEAIATYREKNTFGENSEERLDRLTPQQAAVVAGQRAQRIMADRIARINRGEEVREQ